MSPDWPWALLLVLISPAVGSFLGVVVDRLTRKVPVLWQPSSCTACGMRLAWRDMVPVLSALSLRQRCRGCGAPIPGHLMRIEIAAILAALLAVALVPDLLQMWLIAALLWCLIALFYCDLLVCRLPDPLNLTLLILALVLAAITPGRGLLDGLLGAIIGTGAFWLMRWAYLRLRGREGLGLGDVKLMAGIGAAVGAVLIPVVTLIAALLALAVIALQSLKARRAPDADLALPFGSYLCAAAAIVMLY